MKCLKVMSVNMCCIDSSICVLNMAKYQVFGKKAIISPVPKSAMKDPHVPSEYRGVSLLSHVGKIYSQVLNNSIVSYCEITDLFCDEQNGFCKSRSCEVHIFSPTTRI